MASTTKKIIQEVFDRSLHGENRKILRDKPACTYLNLNSEKFHTENGYAVYLLTVTFLPQEASTAEAWKLIRLRHGQLIANLRERDEIAYVLSTIEEHPTEAAQKAAKKTTIKKASAGAGRPSDDTDDEDCEAPESLSVITDPKPMDASTKYVCEAEDIEDKKFEVIRIFCERNEELSVKSCSNDKNIVERICDYCAKKTKDPEIKESLEYAKETFAVPEEMPLAIFDVAYDYLVKAGNGTISSAGTLARYPHIHMAVCCRTRTGTIIDRDEIGRMAHGIFFDVNTRKKGRQADTSTAGKLLGYVLKNSRHSVSTTLLGRSPCKLYNFHGGAKVNKFFYDLLQCSSTVIDGVEKPGLHHVLELAEKPKLTKQVIIGDGKPVYTDEPPTLKPVASSKKQEAISYIKTYMEEHNLAFGDDCLVYRLAPGSRFTYVVYCTGEALFGKMMDEEHLDLLSSQKAIYDMLSKNPHQSIFRKIKIHVEWIEFKDFFYHVHLGIICREQRLYPAFTYISNFGYDDIARLEKREIFPNMWAAILVNSKYLIPDGDDYKVTPNGRYLLKDLYELLLPKKHKDKSPYIFGGSNACKSSLLAPIVDLFPAQKIATICKSGGFELSNLIGKYLALFEEFDLSTSGLTLPMLKMMLEGGKLPVNAKFKTPETLDITLRSAFTSNHIAGLIETPRMEAKPQTPTRVPPIPSHRTHPELIPEYHYVDLAIANRFNYYSFDPMPEDVIHPGGKLTMCRKEKGMIIMYLALQYFGEFSEIDDIEILEGEISRYHHSLAIDI